jgi:hypothetical protein
MEKNKGLTIFVRSIRIRSMPIIIPQLTIMNEILITMSKSILESVNTMHGPQCIAQSP